MKRGDLIRHLEREGASLLREGANHTIYWMPTTGLQTAVNRHHEIPPFTARKICKELGIKPPPGR